MSLLSDMSMWRTAIELLDKSPSGVFWSDLRRTMMLWCDEK